MKIQKRPRKTPTFKQKIFARKYVEKRGNGTQAALEAYEAKYDDAKQISSQNLQKPIVQEEIKNVIEQLNNSGLNLEFLTQKSVESIQNGMGNKATQKDANDMIKFMFKLHNAIPTNKKVSLHYSIKGNMSQENVTQLRDKLASLQSKSTRIIDDLTA